MPNLSPTSLTKLREIFPTVHHYPFPSSFPEEILREIEMLFITMRGLPPNLHSISQLPKLRHIQTGSAGADKLIHSSFIQDWLKSSTAKEEGREITIGTASGTHVISIPNWVVANLVNIYHQIPRMIEIARKEKRWASGKEVDIKGETYYARSTLGRTVGMLGYGSLGRETARLLKAHGMRVIAANTSGKATRQDGYIISGTGDLDGSIPERFYNTKEPESLKSFLQECDVLVCSLPNTKQTQYFLDAEKMGWMKKDAVFINVGRGTLIRSEEIIKALDSPTNPLLGAAIDVTDPEPLPDNHPLWSHPKCIITPHLSGDAEGEFDIATDIAIENAKRIRDGKQIFNQVGLERGY